VNSTVARSLRISAELLAIAVTVTAIVTGLMYALAAPDFDDPYRGENAWRNFVTGSVVLSALGAAAAGVCGSPGASERVWTPSLTPRPGSSPSLWQPFPGNVVTGEQRC
jgi:hypothetical protein